MRTHKVHEVMTTTDLRSCRATATLAEAAAMMWERDCGAIPVVDEQGHVESMITDRDICIALAMRGARASEIRVGDLAGHVAFVHTCRPEDSIKSALKTMRRAQVRRLPVVNDEGILCGILSINDIIRRADAKDAKKILRALKSIGAGHGEPGANISGETYADKETLIELALQNNSL
jgi:CBS domain-containing protein